MAASQTRAVLSSEAVTTRLPSLLKTAERTGPVWVSFTRRVFWSAALASAGHAVSWAGHSQDPFVASTPRRIP